VLKIEAGWLYSLSFLEGLFSETGLPINGLLGNSGTQRGLERDIGWEGRMMGSGP